MSSGASNAKFALEVDLKGVALLQQFFEAVGAEYVCLGIMPRCWSLSVTHPSDFLIIILELRRM